MGKSIQKKNSIRKLTLKEKIKSMGPGIVITASFIGPGTVTTATRAGANYGYAILWAVLFSVIATMVLQEMSARLGIITQKGLGEAVREQFSNPILKYSGMALVITAITVGCAAYISGDIMGASMGLSTLLGVEPKMIGHVVGIIALGLIISGRYKIVEKALMVLVGIMSITFITTMIIAGPNLMEVIKGAFVPVVPDSSLITIIALIGTTVVPYNFFIHASTVKQRWNRPEHLQEARWDIILSIGLGGLITASILITSGTLLRGVTVQNVSDLSLQLEPLLGNWAKYFTAIGLFSAGISSAIATPLGAAYTISGVLNWNPDIKDKKFRTVCVVIILIGIVVGATGFEPMDVLIFAQAINGILLPVIAIFMLCIMNNKKILKEHTNNLKMNILGFIVVATATFLGLNSFIDAISSFIK